MRDYAEEAAGLDFFTDTGGFTLAAHRLPAVADHAAGARWHIQPLDALAKRSIDVVVAAALLLLLAPLLLLIALAVRSEGAPALFRQPRVGRHGRCFHCLKFRSMQPDAERSLQRLLRADAALREEWQRSQKLQRDPRITPLGRFLRRTSLDELPQLWNVLRGDMSLVGPRPLMLQQLQMYGPLAPCYTATRPGITGLWQVSARGDGDFRRRIALDCAYVRNYRFWADFAILLKTVKVVLRGDGAY